MDEPLLRIRNVHVPSCGDPPILTNDNPECYVGYFQSRFGDQWVFTYDRRTKRGELRGGDCEWGNAFEVVGGVPKDLMLGGPESLWLRACWLAATGGINSDGLFAELWRRLESVSFEIPEAEVTRDEAGPL